MEVGDVIDLEGQCVDARSAKLRCSSSVVVARIEQHEVRACAEHCLDVGSQAAAEIGNSFRLLRIKIPMCAADETVSGAEGKDEIGCSGVERDDSLWRRLHYDGVAEIVGRDCARWLLLFAGEDQKESERQS